MMPPANFDATHLCDFEHHHKYLDPLSISRLSASRPRFESGVHDHREAASTRHR